jgi:hypothetical protein
MVESTARILNSACSMELLRVETADGRYLGHVFDLRCRWDNDSPGEPVIDQLIYGQSGWLERLGLRHLQPRSVHWYLVETVRPGVIVVAASKR